MLPDAEIKLKDVLSATLATAVMFMVVESAISFCINQSDLVVTYGAAGSIVVLLLWTYYSSIILYLVLNLQKRLR